MKTPFGMFIVYGPDDTAAPSVHILSRDATESLWVRQRLALTDTGMRQAIRQTFGTDGLYALPAWSIDCMEQFALTYEGPHRDMLRAVCAAAALGKLWGGEGGEEAPLSPPKPRKPSPSSKAAPVSYFAQLQGGAL
jgi:hypothetical protein